MVEDPEEKKLASAAYTSGANKFSTVGMVSVMAALPYGDGLVRFVAPDGVSFLGADSSASLSRAGFALSSRRTTSSSLTEGSSSMSAGVGGDLAIEITPDILRRGVSVLRDGIGDEDRCTLNDPEALRDAFLVMYELLKTETTQKLPLPKS